MPFAPEPTTADFYKLLQDYSDLSTELAKIRGTLADVKHNARVMEKAMLVIDKDYPECGLKTILKGLRP